MNFCDSVGLEVVSSRGRTAALQTELSMRAAAAVVNCIVVGVDWLVVVVGVGKENVVVCLDVVVDELDEYLVLRHDYLVIYKRRP